MSVILPVLNEAGTIKEVLTAVLRQDYPADQMEILVVDGMSEDGTREIVRELAAQDPRVHLLDNPGRTTSPGLNLGIRAARGLALMRVDGHGVLPPNYLRECVAMLQAETGAERASARRPPRSVSGRGPAASSWPLLAVGGAWDCGGRGIWGRAIALATSSRLGVGNAAYRTASPAGESFLTDSVPFWVMRRDVFERTGLFREEMLCHEDYEFNYRFRQQDGRIILLPWLRAIYYVRPTLRALARQYARYGFWKGRFLRMHPRSLRARHFIPPFFALVLAVTVTWSVFSPNGLPFLGALAGAYALFLLVATVLLVGIYRTSGGRPTDMAKVSQPAARPYLLFLVVPMVLATLHLCWGFGIWAGLLRGAVPGEPPKLAA